MQETWKTIRDFPNYAVSNQGRIKNLATDTILKPWNTSGYHKIELWNEQGASRFRVHRLVAEAFIPNLRNKPEVNHRDGNPINNSIENLEWMTTNENIKWNDYLAFERVISLLNLDPVLAEQLKTQAANTLSPTPSLDLI